MKIGIFPFSYKYLVISVDNFQGVSIISYERIYSNLRIKFIGLAVIEPGIIIKYENAAIF